MFKNFFLSRLSVWKKEWKKSFSPKKKSCFKENSIRWQRVEEERGEEAKRYGIRDHNDDRKIIVKSV